MRTATILLVLVVLVAGCNTPAAPPASPSLTASSEPPSALDQRIAQLEGSRDAFDRLELAILLALRDA